MGKKHNKDKALFLEKETSLIQAKIVKKAKQYPPAKYKRLDNDASVSTIGRTHRQADKKTFFSIGYTSPIATTNVPPAGMINSIAPRHPFPTHHLDHCETPRVAYQHLECILRTILSNSCNSSNNKNNNMKEIAMKHRKKRPEDALIWDPFYCDGAAKRHLQSLGFHNVHHTNEDFYKIIHGRESSSSSFSTTILTDYDILVTNPPYSDRHIEQLFAFLFKSTTTNKTTLSKNMNENNKASTNPKSTKEQQHQQTTKTIKPFCLLLPNWVARKRNYRNELLCGLPANEMMVYLSPVVPYTYQMPSWNQPHAPEHVSQGVTTPYLSSWYIYGLSESQFQEINALTNHLPIAATSNNNIHTNIEWVVAKTIKGLKWKIQKARASREREKRLETNQI